MNRIKNTSSTEIGEGLLTNVKGMAHDIMTHGIMKNVRYYDEYRHKDNETISEETRGKMFNKIFKK